MTDPIIDIMTRIKNGYMAHRETVDSPHSKYKEEVLKKMKSLKYIEDYEVSGDIIKHILITLHYDGLVPAVTGMKFYSTPGRRWYTTMHDLKPVVGGMGYSIISTSAGIMTNIEARKKNIGGELLFAIW